MERGHDATKVKEAMFTSLEGMARDNSKMIDENGNFHVTQILDRLDSLYGVSMMFQSLNAAHVAFSRSLLSQLVPTTITWPRLSSPYMSTMDINNGWVSWCTCPKIAFPVHVQEVE